MLRPVTDDAGGQTDEGQPLRIVRARPADPVEGLSGRDANYTVYLELSRKVTEHERAAGARLESVRLYGETLEIRETTLELVAKRKSELQAMVLDVEMKGRVLAIAAKRIEANQRLVQPDPELIARSERNHALMEARDAERERRRKLAEDIAFD